MLARQRRSDAPELMDTEAVDAGSFEACLRDLERINRWTLAYRITLSWLERLLIEGSPTRPLRVLDVGSGYGDMLRRIWQWAQRRDLEVELTGVDRHPHARSAAARATPPEAPIRYVCADLFELPEDGPDDVVISALFAHHLDDAQLVRFIRWMEGRARRGWLINDLHRHPLPYVVARHAPRLLKMHRLVRHDAALSVARSFDRRDWERLLRAADLAPRVGTIEWQFPFRYAVSRIKPV